MVEPTEKRPAYLPALASGLLALALYAVTLGGTYIYDDFGILHVDDRLTVPAKWGHYWYEPYNGGIDNLYRPLVSMTYAIQWWLHGINDDRAWLFHAVNWLMNAGVCALVAEFARRLTRRWNVGMIAGLLFAAHPLHVEAAAYIAGRAELMCALGAVGALVVLLQRPMTTRRAIAVFALFLVALLSKEQGMLVPLLMVLMVGLVKWSSAVVARPQAEDVGALEYQARESFAPGPERRAYQILTMLVTFTCAGYIVFREWVLKFWWDRNFLDWTINPMVLAHGRDRWLMPLVLLGKYTQLLIVPWRLSPDYGGKVFGWTVNLSDPYLYLGIAAVITWLSLAVFATLKRKGVTFFCLLGLAITYGLIANLVTIIGTNFGERLMYLPSVFFVLLIAMLLARLPRPIMLFSTTLLVTLGSARTVTYVARWNDRLHFYQQSLAEQPHAIRLYMLLAEEYRRLGEYDRAAAVISQARQELPEYDEVWIHSAAVALEQKKFDLADQFLDQAIDVKLHRPDLYRGQGIFKALGWKDKIANLRKAATQPTTAPSGS
jgi:hypothetical protein